MQLTKMAKKIEEIEEIPIAGDHKAYKLKKNLVSYLSKLGYKPLDLGTYSEERTDYPVYAALVAAKVSNGECRRGIVICYTGIGVSITANKFPRVRAAPCMNEKIAELTRKHNNSNILALAAGYTKPNQARKIVKKWMDTEYEGGRHQKRLDLISKIEGEIQ